MSNWQPYEDGQTIGKKGPEGGVIVLDDEHVYGARITLEQGCLRAPYGITCGVYGWLVHTRFVADDESAQHAVEEMRKALTEIVALLPAEEADDDATDYDEISAATAAFGERFA